MIQIIGNITTSALLWTSNLLLTISVYIYKYTRPKKEKYMHDLVVVPPNIYDFGAETGNRNSALTKVKKCLNEIHKDSLMCQNETF